jgi:hypothetical protein
VGLWERLGIKQSQATTIDWASVVEIDDKRIVVDNQPEVSDKRR